MREAERAGIADVAWEWQPLENGRIFSDAPAVRTILEREEAPRHRLSHVPSIAASNMEERKRKREEKRKEGEGEKLDSYCMNLTIDLFLIVKSGLGTRVIFETLDK